MPSPGRQQAEAGRRNKKGDGLKKGDGSVTSYPMSEPSPFPPFPFSQKWTLLNSNYYKKILEWTLLCAEEHEEYTRVDI